MIDFYNAEDIFGVENYKLEEATLENVLEFLEVRGLIENSTDIISLQDRIDAVGKYAEKLGANELTKILSEIEKKPDKIFEVMNKFQTILKNLKQKKLYVRQKK